MKLLETECPCCNQPLAANRYRSGWYVVWCRNAWCESEAAISGSIGETVGEATWRLTAAIEEENEP